MPQTEASNLLGGLTPAQFLARHWQKKPLLVRQALPGFHGIVDRDRLFALAGKDDAPTRIVTTSKKKGHDAYDARTGPFFPRDFKKLEGATWTVLVQGTENFVPEAWDLVRRFDFLPRARFDDVMISYATKGASVGPHVDLYDVFLLQGPGRRRWRIATGGPRALDETSPLPVLKTFEAEEEWVLDPGDMLYLPPNVAHWGIAEDDDCFTYSIGAVAPSHEALLQNALGYFSQRIEASVDNDAMYEDPDLRTPSDPFAIDDEMVQKLTAILDGARLTDDLVVDFLGRLLTGPKPHIRFRRPRQVVGDHELAMILASAGTLSLASPSRGLVRGRIGFLNGTSFTMSEAFASAFGKLLRDRQWTLPVTLDADARTAIGAWIASGFVELITSARAPTSARGTRARGRR